MIKLTKSWKRFLPGAVLSDLGGGVEDLLVNRMKVAEYVVPSGTGDGTNSGATDIVGGQKATRAARKRFDARHPTASDDPRSETAVGEGH